MIHRMEENVCNVYWIHLSLYMRKCCPNVQNVKCGWLSVWTSLLTAVRGIVYLDHIVAVCLDSVMLPGTESKKQQLRPVRPWPRVISASPQLHWSELQPTFRRDKRFLVDAIAVNLSLLSVFRGRHVNRFGSRKQKPQWGSLAIVVLPATSSSTVFPDSDLFTCAHFCLFFTHLWITSFLPCSTAGGGRAKTRMIRWASAFVPPLRVLIWSGLGQ